MKKEPKKLTKRQANFVEEYVKPETKSATQAAVKAGYSKNSAAESASENLRNSKVLEQIELRKRRAEKSANVTAEQIIGATAEIAFSSIKDATDNQGNLDYQKACETGAVDHIKKITRTPTKYGDVVSWEFHSRADALAKLGNYIGVENFAPKPSVMTDADLAAELFRRLVTRRNLSVEEAIEGIRQRFPDVDTKMLRESI